jgi:nucleotide-binding universal stress UspA family protein
VTVVVGYRAGEVGLSGLYLAVRVARTLNTSLTVATIMPKPWPTPSFARVDAEYEQWADRLAADSAEEAAGYLYGLADGVEVTYLPRANRSVSGGLIEVIADVDAEVVVLGSLPSGGRGQVVIGSTADWLLHVSPVPVAISPRGYRSYTGGLTRLTCAYAATPDSIDVVRRCFEFARRLGLPVRVITFAVRGKTMYPPEVGLDAEDSILEAWASQAREALENLKTETVVSKDVVLEVITGHSWKEALGKAEWQDGDIRRVFLGSRSGKIIRESSAPVVVLPG